MDKIKAPADAVSGATGFLVSPCVPRGGRGLSTPHLRHMQYGFGLLSAFLSCHFNISTFRVEISGVL